MIAALVVGLVGAVVSLWLADAIKDARRDRDNYQRDARDLAAKLAAATSERADIVDRLETVIRDLKAESLYLHQELVRVSPAGSVRERLRERATRLRDDESPTPPESPSAQGAGLESSRRRG